MRVPLGTLLAACVCSLAFSVGAASPVPSRTFSFTYTAVVRDLPQTARRVEVWIPYPQSDPHQTIHSVRVSAAAAMEIAREPEYGNQAIYLLFDRPNATEIPITITVTASRREYRRELTPGRTPPERPEALKRFLKPDRLVPIDGRIREEALAVTKGKRTELEKARALYDHVTRTVKYDKSGEGWGRGDALFACDARRGNCTDFHALLIGMARAVGIPAKFAIGFPLPTQRGEGEIGGYHCWAELYVRGIGWVPVDSSEASKDPSKFDYFFGTLDENRLQLTVGRDLTLQPRPKGEPLNYFVYPYVEVDGRPHAPIDRRFAFRDLPSGPGGLAPGTGAPAAGGRRHPSPPGGTDPRAGGADPGTAKGDTAAPADPAPPEPVATRPGFRARLYGFARADLDIDSRKIFAGPHLPFWVLSPDDPRAGSRADGAFTIHARLTRLGLDTEAPTIRRLGDAALTGKVEIDFFNILPDRNSATSNSRAFVRMRHAYGQLRWKNATFLFGQYWDLISPLFPAANFDVVMWNAGNTADRRPQLRFTWEPVVGDGAGSLGLMVGSPSAVDSQDLDADQIVDGEESRVPTLQMRAAVNQPSWVPGQRWEVGLWGHRGQFRVDRARAIAGRRNFDSYAAGVDFRVPVSRRLLFQGEAWFGKALSDVRGGVGQSVNTVTGQEVRARGGWVEVLHQFGQLYTLGAGLTLDDPIDRDVVVFDGTNPTATGRTQNRTYYIVNRLNLGGGLLIGIDWMLFETKFRGLSPGSSNRWNTWIQHNF